MCIIDGWLRFVCRGYSSMECRYQRTFRERFITKIWWNRSQRRGTVNVSRLHGFSGRPPQTFYVKVLSFVISTAYTVGVDTSCKTSRKNIYTEHQTWNMTIQQNSLPFQFICTILSACVILVDIHRLYKQRNLIQVSSKQSRRMNHTESIVFWRAFSSHCKEVSVLQNKQGHPIQENILNPSKVIMLETWTSSH